MLSSNCILLNFPDDLSSGRQVSDDIFCFASRIVDQTIGEMSEYLSDGEITEVAEALHDLLNRWRNPPTA